MPNFNMSKAGVGLQDGGSIIRRCTLIFTEGSLAKSVVANDGFNERQFSVMETNVDNTGWYFIDVIRAPGVSTVTLQAYKTAAKDEITPAELAAAANKYGPKYTRRISDNIQPDPKMYIKSVANTQYVTFVADKPCSMEISILYHDEQATNAPL